MILWIQVLLPEYYNFFKSAILYLVTWLILLLTKLLSLNQNSKSITIGALQHAVTSPGRWYSSHTSGPIRGHRRRQGSHSQLAFSPQPPHLYHSHQRLRGIHIKACICFKSFVYPYPSSWNSLLLCIDKLSINPIFKLSALIILFPAVQTNKRIDGFLASYSLAHHSYHYFGILASLDAQCLSCIARCSFANVDQRSSFRKATVMFKDPLYVPQWHSSASVVPHSFASVDLRSEKFVEPLLPSTENGKILFLEQTD